MQYPTRVIVRRSRTSRHLIRKWASWFIQRKTFCRRRYIYFLLLLFFLALTDTVLLKSVWQSESIDNKDAIKAAVPLCSSLAQAASFLDAARTPWFRNWRSYLNSLHSNKTTFLMPGRLPPRTADKDSAVEKGDERRGGEVARGNGHSASFRLQFGEISAFSC